MKLGSKKKIEHNRQIQWVNKTNTESVLTLRQLAFQGKQCLIRSSGRLCKQQTENCRAVGADWTVVFKKSLIDQARNSCEFQVPVKEIVSCQYLVINEIRTEQVSGHSLWHKLPFLSKIVIMEKLISVRSKTRGIIARLSSCKILLL